MKWCVHCAHEWVSLPPVTDEWTRVRPTTWIIIVITLNDRYSSNAEQHICLRDGTIGLRLILHSEIAVCCALTLSGDWNELFRLEKQKLKKLSCCLFFRLYSRNFRLLGHLSHYRGESRVSLSTSETVKRSRREAERLQQLTSRQKKRFQWNSKIVLSHAA